MNWFHNLCQCCDLISSQLIHFTAGSLDSLDITSLTVDCHLTLFLNCLGCCVINDLLDILWKSVPEALGEQQCICQICVVGNSAVLLNLIELHADDRNQWVLLTVNRTVLQCVVGLTKIDWGRVRAQSLELIQDQRRAHGTEVYALEIIWGMQWFISSELLEAGLPEVDALETDISHRIQ